MTDKFLQRRRIKKRGVKGVIMMKEVRKRRKNRIKKRGSVDRGE